MCPRLKAQWKLLWGNLSATGGIVIRSSDLCYLYLQFSMRLFRVKFFKHKPSKLMIKPQVSEVLCQTFSIGICYWTAGIGCWTSCHANQTSDPTTRQGKSQIKVKHFTIFYEGFYEQHKIFFKFDQILQWNRHDKKLKTFSLIHFTMKQTEWNTDRKETFEK